MEDMLYQACQKLHFGSNIVDNAKTIKKSNHLEFLLELFTLELEHRDMKRRNTYIKQAKFDLMKTFEDYTFDIVNITLHFLLEKF